MNYRETLERLFALRRFGVRPGVEGVRAALNALGDPHRKFSALHIAGTNGKGSTAAFCEALARAAGKKTGLYTSPHLLRFTERIRVGGVEIGEDEVAELASELFARVPQVTFFEAATAVAFAAFAARGVEIAVVECGLGGRNDATNVFDAPLATCVTTVAHDHVEVIGPTLADIAREKAGIFRRGVPAIVGRLPEEARAVIEEEAQKIGAPLERLGRDFSYYSGELAMAGAHQRDNAALALRMLQCSKIQVDEAALATVRWPGRLEAIADDLLVDAAHNPEGAQALARALEGKTITLVFGCVDDKDAAAMLAPLLPLAARVIFVRPPSPRARDPESLRAVHPTAEVMLLEDALAARGGLTVVAGSLFLVGQARALVLGEPADPIAAQDPAAKKL